jgi:hypothetical protein
VGWSGAKGDHDGEEERFGGLGKGKLIGARPSTVAKSGGGDSTPAGQRRGGWRQWSSRRAPGHRYGARGCAGSTERWPEQAVCMEALGGSGAGGNHRRWCCTATVGIRGQVGEIFVAHAGLEKELVGRFGVRLGWSMVACVADMVAAFLGTAVARGVEASLQLFFAYLYIKL